MKLKSLLNTKNHIPEHGRINLLRDHKIVKTTIIFILRKELKEKSNT